MAVLKERLDQLTYDQVRGALGLEPLAIAAEKGAKIGSKVRENLVK
jgi:hypothetical protein